MGIAEGPDGEVEPMACGIEIADGGGDANAVAAIAEATSDNRIAMTDSVTRTTQELIAFAANFDPTLTGCTGYAKTGGL